MFIEEVIAKWRKGWRGKVKDNVYGKVFIFNENGIETEEKDFVMTIDPPLFVNMFTATFTEILPKPVDFLTAANSNRLIKPKDVGEYVDYQSLQTWIGRMASGGTKGLYPRDFINAEWYVADF